MTDPNNYLRTVTAHTSVEVLVTQMGCQIRHFGGAYGVRTRDLRLERAVS